MRALVFLALLLPAVAAAQTFSAPCTKLVPTDVQGADVTITDYCLETKSYTQPVTPIVVSGTQEVDLWGDQSVTITPGTWAGNFSGNGHFRAKAGNPDFNVVVMSMTNTLNTQCTFDKFELGLQLPNPIEAEIDKFLANSSTGLNPFNPAEISVEATVTHASGSSKTIYGFYMHDYEEVDTNGDQIPDVLNQINQNYNWRIRHAFEEPGGYTIDISVVGSGFGSLSLNGINVTVLDAGNPGYLTVGTEDNDNDRYLRYSGNGESFFALGITYPTHLGAYFDQTNIETRGYYDNLLQELAASSGNFTRIWAVSQSFGFEWEELGNYATGNSRSQNLISQGIVPFNRQQKAWVLDQIFGTAEANDIHIMLCLESASQLAPNTPGAWPPDNWVENPYFLELPSVNSPNEFFTDAAAKAMYKRKLRYLIARYGYSTSLGMYELWNEIDHVYTGYSELNYNSGSGSEQYRLEINDWHAEMADYIKLILGDERHPITTSVATSETKDMHTKPWWCDNIDILQMHNYSWTVEANEFRHNRLKTLSNMNWIAQYTPQRQKPVLLGEMGTQGILDGCSRRSVQQYLWASAFFGGLGAGLNFSGHWIHDSGFQTELQPLATFLSDVDWKRTWNPRKWNNQPNDPMPFESYQLVSGDKNYSIGWVGCWNFDWSAYRTLVPCVDDLILNGDGTNTYTELPDSSLVPVQGKKAKIKGLKALTNYTIEWYNTNTGTLESTSSKGSNALGVLRPDIPLVSSIFPDWAYRVYKTSVNSFKVDSAASFGGVDAPHSEKFATESTGDLETLQAYPNPTEGEVTVVTTCLESKIIVYNSQGQPVLATRATSGRAILNLVGQPAGLYCIVVVEASKTQIILRQ